MPKEQKNAAQEEIAEQLDDFSKSLIEYFREHSFDMAVFNDTYIAVKNRIDNNVKLKNPSDDPLIAVLEKIPINLFKSMKLYIGNNLNLEIKSNNTSVFFQCTEVPDSFLKVTEKKLSNSKGESPSYMAETYSKQHSSKQNDKEGLQVIATFVETLPISPAKHITDLNQKQDQQTILRFTANMGVQICNILNDLSNKEILWTDLKLGNILMRKDESVVIADRKALMHKSVIPLRESTSYRTSRDFQEGHVKLMAGIQRSDPYISANRDQKLLEYIYLPNKAKAPNYEKQARSEIFQEWQKEYSYQLAIVLYMAAANVSDKDDAFTSIMNNKRDGFDFNLPVFASREGKALRDIIYQLSDPDPNNRMTIDKAAYLLNEIGIKLSQTNVTTTAITNSTQATLLTKFKTEDKNLKFRRISAGTHREHRESVSEKRSEEESSLSASTDSSESAKRDSVSSEETAAHRTPFKKN